MLKRRADNGGLRPIRYLSHPINIIWLKIQDEFKKSLVLNHVS
jgi:hypothetical protein